MKQKQSLFFNTAKTVALFLLCGGLLTSCLPSSPAGSSRGQRKKMFTLDGADGSWEGYSLAESGGKAGPGVYAESGGKAGPGVYAESGVKAGTGEPGTVGVGQPVAAGVPALPFALSDTLLQQGAGLHPYVLLRLSSADYDLLLLGAKSYEAWFPGWLKSWQQTGREGLMIDLSAGKATGQSVFRLTAPGLDKPVPLVLLWDAAGQARAAFYTQLLQSLTSINAK